MTEAAPRIVLALAASCAWVPGAGAQSEVFRVDPGQTRAEFAVEHFWVTTLHGRFARSEGMIVLDANTRAGSIDFAIDANSVDTGWSVRDDFIRGELMFDTEHFPLVRFHATELTFEGPDLVGASGELTLHSVTRPVVVRVERMQCGRDRTAGSERCGVSVLSSIKRSDFGMTFGLPFVGDQIDLSFHLTARRIPSDPAVSEAGPQNPER